MLKHSFQLDGRVGRAEYVRVGVVCALIKYAVDFALHFAITGEPWWPLRYLSPWFSDRYGLVSAMGDGATFTFFSLNLVWTLPFLWISLAMSARRARDAKLTPWEALWLFVPIANLVQMLRLSLLATRPHFGDAEDRPVARTPGSWTHPVVVFAIVAVVATIALVVWTEALRSYGFVLFVSTPALVGVVVGARFGGTKQTRVLSIGMLTFVTSFVMLGMLMLIGLEGLVCVAMAFPVVGVAVLVGVLIGSGLVKSGPLPEARSVGLLLVALPASATLDDLAFELPVHEVVSVVEIDAPPSEVWQHVVEFSELPTPDTWLFDTGIAYPLRARIEGRGVGAVRYCEFSTGAFVEPITAWDEPHRLAFDVRSQPVPMEEWSFYAHVHPPHLDETFRSVRGEFRLVALPGGRTRLEGSTWYTLDMGPVVYWKLWSDGIIHRIHERVLRHIERLAEAD